MSEELHPNTTRALSVIIQNVTDGLTDKERVLFLLYCANAEYHQSDSIDTPFRELALSAENEMLDNYNYDTDQ